MVSDYTVNDAFKDGFEDGLLYMLRYMAEVEGRHLSDREVLKLAEHLGVHKSWRPEEIWADVAHRHVDRWGR